VAAAALVTGGVVGCSDDGGEPTVTISEIVIIPGSVSFDALGDTRSLFTNVRDQDGIAIDGAQVAWTSSDPSVVSVDAAGVVTAEGNGTATVVASYEGVEASIPAEVQQRVARTRIVSGDGQVGVVGTELEEPLVLQVLDSGDAGVRDFEITFEADETAGAVFPTRATTDVDGRVEARWRLGPFAGQGLTIRAVTESGTLAIFEAEAVPGPPEDIRVISGDDQVGVVTRPLARPLQLRLADGFNNALSDQIDLEVTAGGGALDRTSLVTDRAGVGSFRWTLGPEVGAQEVTATSGSRSITIRATAVDAAGSPATIIPVSGDAPAAPAESPVPPVTIQVVDGQGAGVEGVAVTFSPSDGNVDPVEAVTDAAGVASTTWTLGARVGTQTLTISADGLPPLVIEAQADDPLPSCDPPPVNGEGYDLQLCYLSELTAPVEAAFENARDRWEEVIVGDLSDIEMDLDGTECNVAGLPIQGLVDDVVIYVTVEEIDGPFNILGSAGPCFVRNSNDLSIVGSMRFDVEDLDRVLQQGRLEDLILHEMGHVLGIGTLWSRLGFLQNPSNGQEPLPDTHFTGPLAIAAFDDAGGDARAPSSGAKVPVENSGGGGTRNGHWRESTMNRELMTGFLDGGANPLSSITIASLADMGYEVEPAVADTYVVPAPNGVPSAHDAHRLHLVDDILWMPIRLVDEEGRVVRIIQPRR
jgi:hypothetical protein